ncbi:MAG: hypothetical protein WBM38_02455 [Arenicellales bacterium]|jgi:hypothetical protein
MLNSYNRFALIMAAIVGAWCVVLGIWARSLFLLLAGGGILYTVIKEFRKDKQDKPD